MTNSENPAKIKINDLLDRFISQLDTLIPIRALAREEVFNLLNQNRAWFSENEYDFSPLNHDTYQTLVLNSTLVLGYSYWEAFLSDLAKEIFLSNNNMLLTPLKQNKQEKQEKQNKQISYEEIIKAKNYDELIKRMIEKECYDFHKKSVDDFFTYFEKKLNIPFSEQLRENFKEFKDLRNCIVHKEGVVDDKLSENSTYRNKKGRKIQLTIRKIDTVGKNIRKEARRLCKKAIKNMPTT